MLYSGMRLPARRLYEMGTVNRLFSSIEELQSQTLAFARQLAEADPLALRRQKRASNITTTSRGWAMSRTALRS